MEAEQSATHWYRWPKAAAAGSNAAASPHPRCSGRYAPSSPRRSHPTGYSVDSRRREGIQWKPPTRSIKKRSCSTPFFDMVACPEYMGNGDPDGFFHTRLVYSGIHVQVHKIPRLDPVPSFPSLATCPRAQIREHLLIAGLESLFSRTESIGGPAMLSTAFSTVCLFIAKETAILEVPTDDYPPS